MRGIEFFFCNDTATTEIYTLSLHDALPIWSISSESARVTPGRQSSTTARTSFDKNSILSSALAVLSKERGRFVSEKDRKSTRLNSSHANISYAVFCLKKKN